MMSLVSTEFLIFVLVLVIGYYLIPKKGQWFWLLMVSYLDYLSSGFGVFLFLLSRTLTTYATGYRLEMIEKSVTGIEIGKNEKKRKKKRVLILASLAYHFENLDERLCVLSTVSF